MKDIKNMEKNIGELNIFHIATRIKFIMAKDAEIEYITHKSRLFLLYVENFRSISIKNK